MRLGRRLPSGRGVLLPVLAAALVIVVVALSLALPGLLHASQPGRPGRPPVTGAGTPGVPRYYVTGSGPQEAHGVLRPVNALVVDSATGTVVATVTPPPGFASFALFGGGAADDRTFVVAAQKYWRPAVDYQGDHVRQAPYLDNDTQPLTFFVLTFNPATSVVTLRRLPPVTVRKPPLALGQISLPGHPGLRTHEVQATVGEAGSLAVSPDGTRLAIMLSAATPDGLANALYVRVISLDSAVPPKNWEAPGPLDSKQFPVSSKISLSWGPGGQVVFATVDGVALLDTGKPGGSLLAQSRIVRLSTRPPKGTTLGNEFWCPVPPTLTGDGTTLVCAGQLLVSGAGGRAVATAIGRYSALTGQLESLSGMQPYSAHPSLATGEIAWASRDGDALVAYRRNPYDVTFMPLNGPTSVVEIRDGRIARTIPLPRWAATSTTFTGLGNSIAW